MAALNWANGFVLDNRVNIDTISEIRRFIVESCRHPAAQQATAAMTLTDIIERADLHFTVDNDVAGEMIRDSLENIVVEVLFLPANIALHDFWLETLLSLCLMMAARLALYRQEINPSPTLTQNLQRFVQGLRGFAIIHELDITLDDEEQWKNVIHQIQSDRTKVLVAQQKWQNRVMRMMDSPMIQIVSVAHELKKTRNRKTHARYTLANIVELQSREISTLTTLRKVLEGALGEAGLHRSNTHLFTANSYLLAETEIDAVLRSSATERDQTMLLMQKRFELLALHEMTKVLQSGSKCFKIIGNMLETTVPDQKERCLVVLEQIIELFWIQKSSMNVKHSDIVVDLEEFKKVVRTLIHLGDPVPLYPVAATPVTAATVASAAGRLAVIDRDLAANAANADMWRPSLLKLEDMIRSGHLTIDSVEVVYDAILIPTYTQGGGSMGGAGWAGQTAPIEFTQKRTSMHAAVVQQREVVRGLMREIVKGSSRVQIKATRVDDEMATFVRFVMNPFLIVISGQWTREMVDYLKPMTLEHDDPAILTGASNWARDRAVERSAPQRLNHVAASLSSSTIVILQVIKISRLFIQIGAAFVAQKVFNESYVRKVFSEGRDPPPLTSMLFLMLSIDATAHLMLIILLVLSSFAFKTETNTYIVDDLFLADVLAEFAMSSIVLIIIGMMVGDTLRRKRYFQYADQGQVVSVAYRTALLYICIVNFVIPYSMLIS